MVIQNGTVETARDGHRLQQPGAGAVGQQSGGSNVLQQQPADRVHLSGASDLVALAKKMVPSDKQAQFQTVRAQVASGQYQSDPTSVGRAVVQAHIGS